MLQDWVDTQQFPNATHCSLGINSWEDLVRMRRSQNMTVATGSLGRKTIPGVYDTWACIKNYKQWLDRCAKDTGASPGDFYCFVFLDSGDKIHGTFLPWGNNKDLKLVKSTCAR
jgi:hypothetical protein